MAGIDAKTRALMRDEVILNSGLQGLAEDVRHVVDGSSEPAGIDEYAVGAEKERYRGKYGGLWWSMMPLASFVAGKLSTHNEAEVENLKGMLRLLFDVAKLKDGVAGQELSGNQLEKLRRVCVNIFSEKISDEDWPRISVGSDDIENELKIGKILEQLDKVANVVRGRIVRGIVDLASNEDLFVVGRNKIHQYDASFWNRVKDVFGAGDVKKTLSVDPASVRTIKVGGREVNVPRGVNELFETKDPAEFAAKLKAVLGDISSISVLAASERALDMLGSLELEQKKFSAKNALLRLDDATSLPEDDLMSALTKSETLKDPKFESYDARVIVARIKAFKEKLLKAKEMISKGEELEARKIVLSIAESEQFRDLVDAAKLHTDMAAIEEFKTSVMIIAASAGLMEVAGVYVATLFTPEFVATRTGTAVAKFAIDSAKVTTFAAAEGLQRGALLGGEIYNVDKSVLSNLGDYGLKIIETAGMFKFIAAPMKVAQGTVMKILFGRAARRLVARGEIALEDIGHTAVMKKIAAEAKLGKLGEAALKAGLFPVEIGAFQSWEYLKGSVKNSLGLSDADAEIAFAKESVAEAIKFVACIKAVGSISRPAAGKIIGKKYEIFKEKFEGKLTEMQERAESLLEQMRKTDNQRDMDVIAVEISGLFAAKMRVQEYMGEAGIDVSEEIKETRVDYENFLAVLTQLKAAKIEGELIRAVKKIAEHGLHPRKANVLRDRLKALSIEHPEIFTPAVVDALKGIAAERLDIAAIVLCRLSVGGNKYAMDAMTEELWMEAAQNMNVSFFDIWNIANKGSESARKVSESLMSTRNGWEFLLGKLKTPDPSVDNRPVWYGLINAVRMGWIFPDQARGIFEGHRGKGIPERLYQELIGRLSHAKKNMASKRFGNIPGLLTYSEKRLTKKISDVEGLTLDGKYIMVQEDNIQGFDSKFYLIEGDSVPAGLVGNIVARIAAKSPKMEATYEDLGQLEYTQELELIDKTGTRKFKKRGERIFSCSDENSWFETTAFFKNSDSVNGFEKIDISKGEIDKLVLSHNRSGTLDVVAKWIDASGVTRSEARRLKIEIHRTESGKLRDIKMERMWVKDGDVLSFFRGASRSYEAKETKDVHYFPEDRMSLEVDVAGAKYRLPEAREFVTIGSDPDSDVYIRGGGLAPEQLRLVRYPSGFFLENSSPATEVHVRFMSGDGSSLLEIMPEINTYMLSEGVYSIEVGSKSFTLRVGGEQVVDAVESPVTKKDWAFSNIETFPSAKKTTEPNPEYSSAVHEKLLAELEALEEGQYADFHRALLSKSLNDYELTKKYPTITSLLDGLEVKIVHKENDTYLMRDKDGRYHSFGIDPSTGKFAFLDRALYPSMGKESECGYLTDIAIAARDGDATLYLSYLSDGTVLRGKALGFNAETKRYEPITDHYFPNEDISLIGGWVFKGRPKRLAESDRYIATGATSGEAMLFEGDGVNFKRTFDDQEVGGLHIVKIGEKHKGKFDGQNGDGSHENIAVLRERIRDDGSKEFVEVSREEVAEYLRSQSKGGELWEIFAPDSVEVSSEVELIKTEINDIQMNFYRQIVRLVSGNKERYLELRVEAKSAGRAKRFFGELVKELEQTPLNAIPGTKVIEVYQGKGKTYGFAEEQWGHCDYTGSIRIFDMKDPRHDMIATSRHELGHDVHGYGTKKTESIETSVKLSAYAGGEKIDAFYLRETGRGYFRVSWMERFAEAFKLYLDPLKAPVLKEGDPIMFAIIEDAIEGRLATMSVKDAKLTGRISALFDIGVRVVGGSISVAIIYAIFFGDDKENAKAMEAVKRLEKLKDEATSKPKANTVAAAE